MNKKKGSNKGGNKGSYNGKQPLVASSEKKQEKRETLQNPEVQTFNRGRY